MTPYKSSIWRVFSIIQNVKKSVDGKIINIDTLVARTWFDNAPKYVVTICKKIYNDLENSWYSYQDFIIYLYYQYIFESKINFKNLKYDNVKLALEILSLKEVNKNQGIITELNKQVGLRGIEDYFAISEDGESIIYKLIIQGLISPLFFIKYQKYANKTMKQKSKKYQEFEIIIIHLKQHLITKMGAKNASKKI